MNCILYETAIDQKILANNALISAQQEAIKQSLPFAVVYFHPNADVQEDNQEVLNKLKAIEDDLAKYNIPLMIFIGDKNDRLEGIDIHLKPIKMYDQTLELPTGEKLVTHPIKWPGMVFSTEILKDRILAGL